MDIKQHCSGCIGVVGYMYESACQIPDQPCVNGSENKSSFFCFLPCSVNIIKDPRYLACTEICIGNKAGLFGYHIRTACRDYLIYHGCGSSALPDYSVIYRLSGFFVPYDRSLTLIGNTDRGNIGSIYTEIGHCLSCNRDL